jgi:hypothetical protein
VLRIDASAGHPVDGGAALGLARQSAVLDEAQGAALGHPAEQLVDLDPEQRDEGLLERVRQVRSPALAAGAEHPVLVDTDDGADRGALGEFAEEHAFEGAARAGKDIRDRCAIINTPFGRDGIRQTLENWLAMPTDKRAELSLATRRWVEEGTSS